MPQNATLDAQVLAARQLLQITNASWMTQAVHVAAKLGLADLLANGPRTTAELAQSTETHPGALRQLLRALSSLDICRQIDDDTFAITPLGEPLRANARCSVRGWAIYWGGTAWKYWEHLLYSVRSGASARALVTGAEGFAHLDRDPDAAAIFNQAMVDLTRLVALDVVPLYDFRSKRVVDVGGGYGELLAAILTAYPDAYGVLFDRPHAIDEAQRSFRARGLDPRCEFVAGDFFADVPSAADVYLLKSIVHDWNDEHARLILQACHRNMPATARLILLERVMPDKMSASPEHQMLAQTDLNMLVALGAHERTEQQYSTLLASTGFTNVTFRVTRSSFSIIEAEVADPGTSG